LSEIVQTVLATVAPISDKVRTERSELSKERFAEKYHSDYRWCPIHNLAYSLRRQRKIPKGSKMNCPLCVRDRRLLKKKKTKPLSSLSPANKQEMAF